MARLRPEDLWLHPPRPGDRTAQPGDLTKRLLQLRGLLDLPRSELGQLLKLCELGRNQLNELVNLLELLQLLDLEVFQLLQLLRHGLKQLDDLLQRLRAELLQGLRAERIPDRRAPERLAVIRLQRKWIDAQSLNPERSCHLTSCVTRLSLLARVGSAAYVSELVASVDVGSRRVGSCALVRFGASAYSIGGAVGMTLRTWEQTAIRVPRDRLKSGTIRHDSRNVRLAHAPRRRDGSPTSCATISPRVPWQPLGRSATHGTIWPFIAERHT
jgi:hypothetical protein